MGRYLTEARPCFHDLARVWSMGAPARFSRREVAREEVLALIAAARVAPSADNLQPWRFITVRAAATRRRIASAVPEALSGSVAGARVVLVACGVRTLVARVRTEQPFVFIDVPIAVTHVLLEARELGLACAWTLDVDEHAVREVLAIPDSVRVVAVLAIGWPAR